MSQSQSSFEIQIGVIQDVIASCNQQSQKIESDIKRARDELDELKKIIENKNESCIREIQPRIEQLEQKINFYWDGVKKSNEVAHRDLENEEKIFEECQTYVSRLENRIEAIQSKI